MTLVLGIDSSTQSVKVEVRSLATGEPVATGRAAHPSTNPPRSEQDPEQWWHALLLALEQVGDCLPQVAAVSVAGQQHGLVLLDANGVPLRPAKLWNDTESAPQAKALVDRLGSQSWANATGLVPVASFTLTKLAWVAQNEPHLMDQIGYVMLPHDYLTWRLCGNSVTDRGEASGTAWWSPISGAYRPDLLEAAGLDPALIERMPTVLGPVEPAGTVRAAETGLGENVVVAPGTGDNMAGALGIGLTAGDVCVSVGTSGTAYAVSEVPTTDASGAVAGFADASGRYLPLVATLNATKVTNWMATMMGLDPHELSSLALEAEPGSGGVVTVPYFDGERTPNRPNARGSIVELRTSTSRAQLARSVFEAVTCGLLDGVDALVGAGVNLDGRLVLIGGGAQSVAFQAVFADLAGRAVVVPDAQEAVATGACVQAAAVLSGSDPIELAKAWGLGVGRAIATPTVDFSWIRERYSELTHQLHGC